MGKRILLLSDIDSAHTRKWALSLAERGYEIGIFSLRKSENSWFRNFPQLTVFDAFGFGKEKFREGSRSKLSYLKLVPYLRKVIAEFKPDLVHAHYATSYGLLGVRSRFHPLIISVWGSDIFDFPKASWLNKRLVIYNLKRADRIFSTSHIMKAEILKYVNREVEVTPFGTDVSVFSQKTAPALPGTENAKVIGLVKSMEDKYGISVLIHAFALVKKEFAEPLKLLLAGSGSKLETYRSLAKELKLENDVIFTGQVPADEVAMYHNRFDIFASVSVLDSESFGVSLVEAMACERPAVVSSVGGLKEVAVDGETAIFVPPNDPEKTAAALLKLLRDPALAKKMGEAGRARVLALYDWKKNLDAVELLYRDLLKK